MGRKEMGLMGIFLILGFLGCSSDYKTQKEILRAFKNVNIVSIIKTDLKGLEDFYPKAEGEILIRRDSINTLESLDLHGEIVIVYADTGEYIKLLLFKHISIDTLNIVSELLEDMINWKRSLRGLNLVHFVQEVDCEKIKKYEITKFHNFKGGNYEIARDVFSMIYEIILDSSLKEIHLNVIRVGDSLKINIKTCNNLTI